MKTRYIWKRPARCARALAAAAALVLLAAPLPAALMQEPTSLTQSLQLSGAGHVSIPHDPTLNPGTAITVEAWVRRDNDTRCETVVAKGYITSWWLGFCGQQIRFYGSGSSSLQDGQTAVPANVWTHIAVVYRSGARREYYINGELDYVGPSNDSAPTGNSLPIQIGRDPDGCCAFDGNISNVRIWNIARSQEQIRRYMHIAIDEPLPGLVASWRLAGSEHGLYRDTVGGHDGTAVGTVGASSAHGSPAQSLRMEIDEHFNQLPWTRTGQALAYLPDRDQALLIGGVRAGLTSPAIDRIDAVTGAITLNIGNLPQGLAQSGAAYVPSLDTVFTFGGSSLGLSASSAGVNRIFAINATTGASREVLPGLPQALNAPTAVYHPGHHKIYLFGGRFSGAAVSTIYIFDPETEQITASAGLTLPAVRSHMGASYSPVNGHIYLFGGLGESSLIADAEDTIWQVTSAEDGQLVAVTELSQRLAGPNAFVNTAFDRASGLIYVLAGTGSHWVSAFDPATHQLWRTRLALPGLRTGASALVSAASRHALIIGGNGLGSVRNVWRVPLGSAPPVAIGDWRFPAPVSSQPTTIHGSGRGVAIGTTGHGVYRLRSDLAGRAVYTATNLGSGHASDVRYEPNNDHVWIATQTAGGRLRGAESVNYGADLLGSNQLRAVETRQGYSSISSAPFFGTSDQGLAYLRYIFNLSGGYWQWSQAFAGMNVTSIRHRPSGDVWVIANDSLRRLQIGSFGGTETNFGAPCGLTGLRDLNFSGNGDWWLAADGGEFGNGICRIPAATTPGSGSSLVTTLGSRAQRISNDRDGRVWVALREEAERSGGLAAFEQVGASLRSTDYNWMNSPLGSRSSILISPTQRLWNSGISAVGAVDESVWIGKTDGRLITHTPRWRRIDDAHDLRFSDVRRIGFARGRAFLGGEWGFHVMQPDGVSWDTRYDFGFRDVLGDRAGRIWLATSAGIRLYTSAGFDDLSDREGLRPTWPLQALAEDHHGRVWIGGDNGLTLFDRGRFVFTLDAGTSDLPANQVRALFVDAGNRLWIGTSNGLARLDEDRLVVFNTADGLPGNEIHAIDQLGSGEIVVSTTNTAGIAVYNGTGFSALPTPYAATQYPISVDQDGRLWAGRAMRVGEQWIEHHTTNSGLARQTVYDQAADLGDRVWFAHGFNGLSVRGSTLPPLASSVPVISAVSNLSGTAGDQIVITGSGFGVYRSNVTVHIGQGQATISSVSDTEIQARLTPENTSGDIVVQIAGRRAIWSQKFCAVPTISHFTPTGGNHGMRVNVYGSNFDRNVHFSAGGPERQASAAPTEFQFVISPDDQAGSLVVRNLSHGCNQGTTSERTFQRIAVNFDRVILNQGHTSLGLAGNKPTVVQHYLTTDHWLRDADGYDDRIEIDRLRLRFTQDGTPARVFDIPIETRPPTWPPPWTINDTPPADTLSLPRAWYQDVAMSLHATVTPFVPGDGVVEVESTLLRGGTVLAQNTRSVDMRRADTLNVLLVPIMPNDYTTGELNDMRAQTDGGLDDARQRLFSFGRVNFYWSPSIVRANDVLWDFNEQVDALDAFELYMASHSLERARRSWNSNSSVPRVTIAYGVVHPRASSNPSAGGMAFWPDMSALVNALGLGAIDALCEFGDAVLEFFSLGLFGGEGCDIAVPLYVGWSVSTSNASSLIGHEIGHILGLVRSHAANGSPTSNPSHSVQDEIFGDSTCNDLFDTETSFYSRSRTLYVSPGFEGPVVNPLIRRQYLPALSETATSGDGSVTSGALVDRGKAFMSYACERNNRNVFFEPADVNHLRFEVDPLVLGLGSSSVETGSSRNRAGRAGLRTRSIEGRRIIVSGQVDRDAVTGELIEVKTLGEQGPLDANYETGWRLIQRDRNGTELARQGIFPVFITSEHSRGHGHARGRDSGTQESSLGFFAATLVGAAGVAEIELSYQGTVLDAYAAGPGVPSVSISSPGAGTSYASGSVPVTWSASDPDGDALTITIEYSADNGSNWLPVGYGAGNSGSVDLPVAVLAGSSQARVRVTASDGFQYRAATSAAFTVTGQPPAAYIGAPDDKAIYLEGEPVRLSGGAWDASTLEFDPSGLRWSSNRDGELGHGGVLEAILSVGEHQVTLEATNSAGLSDTALITVTIRGDYDGDGVADEDELDRGFSPLLRHDAWTDEDGDGLPWLMEERWGTDPTDSDSSGSGRSDADDIAAGLDPLDATFTLPPDVLTVTPASVQLVDDRRLGTLVPHDRLQLGSRERAEWSVSANRAWLRPLRSAGITPDTITVTADGEGLPDGVHRATLSFSSTKGNVQIPVTLTVQGSSVQVEDFIFQDRFQAMQDRLFDRARTGLSPAPPIAGLTGSPRRFPLANANAESILAVLRAQRADRSAGDSADAGGTR